MAFDYPFNSWKTYYEALVESCSTEFYGEKYPNYQAAYDTMEDPDYDIIKSLLETGQDPQTGLDMLFQSMIDGHRYSIDMIQDKKFPDIIRLFLEKGAVINIDIILQARAEFVPDYFEEECYSYAARACLLRVIQDFIPEMVSKLNEKIGWDSIIPTYWEDMLDRSSYNLNPEFGDFDTARYKALKFEYEASYK
jgi:hypothetical protein